MKSKILLIAGFAGLFLASGCQKESGFPAPTSIPGESITATPGPGSVTLNWDVPEDADYYYVKVSYTVPEEGDRVRLASVYSNSMVVDDLLNRYGPIDFTLQTFNRDESKAGEKHVVTAQAENAPLQYNVTDKTKDIELTDDVIFVDSNDGKNLKGNLVDGDKNTCYQCAWSSPTPLPHYIVVNLPREVYAFSFSMSTRIHANNDHPQNIKVYAGTTPFDGTSYTPTDEKWNTTDLGVVTTSFESLGQAVAQDFTSGTIKSESPFSTVWFEVTSTTSGNQYYAISELSMKEFETNVYNPETGETTPVGSEGNE